MYLNRNLNHQKPVTMPKVLYVLDHYMPQFWPPAASVLLRATCGTVTFLRTYSWNKSHCLVMFSFSDCTLQDFYFCRWFWYRTSIFVVQLEERLVCVQKRRLTGWRSFLIIPSDFHEHNSSVYLISPLFFEKMIPCVVWSAILNNLWYGGSTLILCIFRRKKIV